MSPRIIIGYDERPEARDAVALGRQLAEAMGAQPLLVTVVSYDPSFMGREIFEHALAEDAAQIFAPALEQLADLDVETRAYGGGSPARALHELAEVEGGELIVLGSTHRGPLGRVLPGSVAERLLHGSPCPVAVAPRGLASHGEKPMRVIGVGFDGSPESHVALDQAAELARAAGATLRVIAVVEPFVPSPLGLTAPEVASLDPGEDPDVRRRLILSSRLDAALESLPEDVEAAGSLLFGAAVEQLADQTQELDLLVLGSRGYGPLRRVLLGDVSARLMRCASCPVLVVPRGAHLAEASGVGRGFSEHPETAAARSGGDEQ